MFSTSSTMLRMYTEFITAGSSQSTATFGDTARSKISCIFCKKLKCFFTDILIVDFK